MLVVAAGAHDRGLIVVRKCSYEQTVISLELRHIGTGYDRPGCTDGAVPVIWAATAYDGIEADRVIIQVVTRACAVTSKQRGNVVACIGARHRLVDLVFHHGASRVVAVVTTQACKQIGGIGTGAVPGAGQNFGVTSMLALAGDDGFPEQGSYALAPQCDVASAGVGRRDAIATRAAMWGVACWTTASIVEMRAQDIGRWILDLRACKGDRSHKHQDCKNGPLH